MVDVSGGGSLAIGLETTHGTYLAPTIFVPITSESLAENRSDPMRKPILGRAVNSGKVEGREHVEGEITMELLPTLLPYFLVASRFGESITKSAATPFLYTAKDEAAVSVKAAKRSLTIGVDRAGVGFTYIGCQVTSFRFFFEDGIAMVAMNIIGREQTETFIPIPVVAPTQTPFAADEVGIEIAATSRVDLDSFEMTFEENGEPMFNLSGNTGADYVKFGEHNVEASFEVDFESKADYALWVARTTQAVKMTLTKSTEVVTAEIFGGLYDSFEVNLSDIGDQVRASATIMGAYNLASSGTSEITVTSVVDVDL